MLFPGSSTGPGEKLLENVPTVANEIVFDKKHLKAVSQGLEAAVNERKGTAWSSRLEDIRIAGKTGTAQVVKLKEKLGKNSDEEDIPYRFRDHALFVAYAPVEAPNWRWPWSSNTAVTAGAWRPPSLRRFSVIISAWRCPFRRRPHPDVR